MLPKTMLTAHVANAIYAGRSLLLRTRNPSIDTEILSEKGIDFGFWKANDFGRKFDERQAALFHEVVYRSLADAQAPGHL